MTDIEEGAEKAEKIYQRLHCAYTVERIECLEGQVWQLKNERDHWRQLALDRKDEVERLKEEVTHSAKAAMEVTSKQCAAIAKEQIKPHYNHSYTVGWNDAANQIATIIHEKFNNKTGEIQSGSL